MANNNLFVNRKVELAMGVALVLFFQGASLAYETETHEELSERTFLNSKLFSEETAVLVSGLALCQKGTGQDLTPYSRVKT